MPFSLNPWSWLRSNGAQRWLNFIAHKDHCREHHPADSVVISVSLRHLPAELSASFYESAAWAARRSCDSVQSYLSAFFQSTFSCRSAFRSRFVLPRMCQAYQTANVIGTVGTFVILSPQDSSLNSVHFILLMEATLIADGSFGSMPA
jgi:hypothetical protein